MPGLPFAFLALLLTHWEVPNKFPFSVTQMLMILKCSSQNSRPTGSSIRHLYSVSYATHLKLNVFPPKPILPAQITYSVYKGTPLVGQTKNMGVMYDFSLSIIKPYTQPVHPSVSILLSRFQVLYPPLDPCPPP